MTDMAFGPRQIEQHGAPGHRRWMPEPRPATAAEGRLRRQRYGCRGQNVAGPAGAEYTRRVRRGLRLDRAVEWSMTDGT